MTYRKIEDLYLLMKHAVTENDMSLQNSVGNLFKLLTNLHNFVISFNHNSVTSNSGGNVHS